MHHLSSTIFSLCFFLPLWRVFCYFGFVIHFVIVVGAICLLFCCAGWRFSSLMCAVAVSNRAHTYTYTYTNNKLFRALLRPFKLWICGDIFFNTNAIPRHYYCQRLSQYQHSTNGSDSAIAVHVNLIWQYTLTHSHTFTARNRLAATLPLCHCVRELNDNVQVLFAPTTVLSALAWRQEPMHFILPSHKYHVVIICGIFAFSVIASSNTPYPYHMDGLKAHYAFYVGDDLGGDHVCYDLVRARVHRRILTWALCVLRSPQNRIHSNNARISSFSRAFICYFVASTILYSWLLLLLLWLSLLLWLLNLGGLQPIISLAAPRHIVNHLTVSSLYLLPISLAWHISTKTDIIMFVLRNWNSVLCHLMRFTSYSFGMHWMRW